MSAEYLLKEIQDMELLHLAADKGNVISEDLMQASASLLSLTMKIRIHLIFHLGDVNLVKMLLQNGFQIDAKDVELGWSPLLRATKLGIHILKFIIYCLS